MHTGFSLYAQIQAAGSKSPHICVLFIYHDSSGWGQDEGGQGYSEKQLLQPSLPTKCGFPPTCHLDKLKEGRQFIKGFVEAIPTLPLPRLQPVCAEPVEFHSHRGLFVSVLASCLGLPWSVSWVCKRALPSVLCFTGCCQSSAAITRLCRLMVCKMMGYRKVSTCMWKLHFSLDWKGPSVAVGHNTVRAGRATQNSKVAGQTAKQCWDSLWS